MGKKAVLLTASLAAWALLAGPLAPTLDSFGFVDHSAFARGNGNGNGNGNANGRDGGGGVGAQSNAGSERGRSAEAHAKNEAIAAMRDELGGRVSALNSTFNGNTSNAAPHSAAGLANGFVEALNDLLGISESEEPEEGATDEAITAAAENLGTLSNKREVDEEDEEALSALSEAINNFGETLGLNLSGDDPASETEAVEDSLEPEASPADAIASQTIDVINNKDGIGLGQEDLEASDDEDDPEFPGE